jgi:hypothetical protein
MSRFRRNLITSTEGRYKPDDENFKQDVTVRNVKYLYPSHFSGLELWQVPIGIKI